MIFLSLLLAAVVTLPASPDGLLWERDWERAAERARRERKLVAVYVSALDCEPCRPFEETTLADPAVVRALEGFVPLRVPLIGAGGESNAPAVGFWIFHPDRTPLVPLGFAGPVFAAANLGFFRDASGPLLEGAEAVAAGRPYEGHMQLAGGFRAVGRSDQALTHLGHALAAARAAGDAAAAQRAEIATAEVEAEAGLRGGIGVETPAARLRGILASAANEDVEAEALRTLTDVFRWAAQYEAELELLARTLERASPDSLLERTALELAGLRSAPPDLILLTPPAPLVGEVPIEIAVRSDRVHRVELRLDGRRVARSDRPPFTATIDVGERLRRRSLEARGYDRSGSLVARHAIHLNLPEAFFDLTLLPPQRRSGQVVIEAAPVVGRMRTVDRVEFWVDSQPAGTVRKPPYRIVVPEGPGSFARAIAWDATGESREAFVFLDPASFSEEVDVNLVEILVNVEDGNQRPIVDLGDDDFRIREKGTARDVRSARLLSTEPLLLGLAVDRSKSLKGVMDQVVRSALSFAASATRGGEIFVVGFDHRAEVLQWKTADPDAVARKVADLEPSGNTALHEAMMYSLMQYQNSSGNRILVLLTDGVDTASRYDLQQLERISAEFAVPIYLVLFHTAEGRIPGSRTNGLRRIAEASGGRTFELSSLDELDGIWRRIQLDVDTRYLLVYKTPLDPEAWRAVEVATNRDGAAVRAVKGLTPAVSR